MGDGIAEEAWARGGTVKGSGGLPSRLSDVEQQLAIIDRADDALKLANLAEAARIWALRNREAAPVVNYATSIKARALKRMAECVDAGQAAGEIATAKDTLKRGPVVTPRNDGSPATLDWMRWDCLKQGCRMLERWNPDCLDGLLPRRSSFGDMDAWAEISGHFLFIEQKGVDAGPVSAGQGYALIRLSQLPNCAVWLIQDRDGGGYMFRDMKPPYMEPIPISADDLADIVVTWGELVSVKDGL